MIRALLSFPRTATLTGLAVLVSLSSASAQLSRKAADVNDPAFIAKSAMEIDKRMGVGFQKAKVQPVPAADDSRWLRRVYLDSIGRIPSYDEAKAFLDDSSADKRQTLINKLMDSEGYVSTMYNYYSDLLRATSRLGTDGSRSGVPYLRWIREAAATNKPYDQFTQELLTTSGGGWEKGKGAVGYFERDRGMPLDNMANTTRIFLGTHIECSQCHDHPYDKWKQVDFYEMSAFTHGLEVGGGKSTQKKYTNEKYNGDDADKDRARRDVYRWLHDNVYDFSVNGGGDGVITLPMDFKEKGGKPGEMVRAKSIYPGAANTRREAIDDAREKFAKWTTAPENPRFTLIIANRMWKRIMGIGLFEPVDKFVEKSKDNPDGTEVSNPELMTYLQELMKSVNYDLKAFQKVILSTRTYALGTNPEAVNFNNNYTFHGRAVRRMSAEQVWDSMAALVVPDIDYRKGGALDPSAVIYGKNMGVSAYEVYKEMKNADTKAIDAFVEKIMSGMRYDKKGEGDASMMMTESMMSPTDTAAAGMMDQAKWAGFSSELLRASELPAPTRPDHFLRKFGQSSREVIEGGSNESDVTQVLSLINGHVESNIVGDSRAVVYKAIDAASSPEGKVTAAFISILSREPTPAELDLMLPEAKKGRDGVKNIIYALLNSNEFIFIL